MVRRNLATVHWVQATVLPDTVADVAGTGKNEVTVYQLSKMKSFRKMN